ncbi:MAG: GTP-binding protein [Rhodobacter sp.]|uniref:CobW family GTP-binding protein n=1 Tax=Pararhodobacter sp. TaxID=2127056 RepID=UPI002BFFC827|nr:CobW family GTP-binding protein [Pararhodobacter sp.]MCC0074471.1 GTP-binding protein [Rhodobacter sp.]HPD92569.1 GTP-binding protein [Pararhodobacter sp.]
MSESPLPVTLLGGYLGAGKTTLVNHLLRHAEGQRLAVLVNDFGDLPIDADLIEARDEDLMTLAGGCVCCTVGDDLGETLRALCARDPRPDQLLIETSGVALPGALAGALSLMRDVALAAVVVLVDAETAPARAEDPYLGDTIRRQIEQADLIVLTKPDLAGAAGLDRARALVAALHPAAAVVEAVEGRVPPALILGPRPRLGEDAAAPETPGHDSLLFRPARPLDARALARGLADPALGVLRAKGVFVDDTGALRLVQGVGARVRLSPPPKGARPGVVVIGRAGGLDAGGLAALFGVSGR